MSQPGNKRKQYVMWAEENLNRALEDIRKNTLSIRGASRAYDIPRATLQDYVKGKDRRVPVSDKHQPGMQGRYPVFDVSFEKELNEHVLRLSHLYYGITKTELCRIAYELAERNHINHRFNHSSKMAGKDWLKGFCSRNPEISLRRAESTSISRVIGFRKSEVTRFYDNLGTVYQQHNFEPQRVYNVDETGLSTVQKLREKIVAAKGEKQVGKIVSGEKGETVTAVCCVSATGSYVPPLLIFPRKKFTDQLMRNAPAGSIGSCSPSGWINADLYLVWLKHFIKHTSASVDRKVLLVLDNHESHVSYESYMLCRDNGVLVVSLPPHSSHKCQPLDLTIYGPMKMAYSKRCSEWLMSHPGKRITQYEIAELFSDAYSKTATVDKAVSGFRASGIYPFNSNIFSDEDFAAADNLLGHPVQPVVTVGQPASDSGPNQTVASTPVPDLDMEVVVVEPNVPTEDAFETHVDSMSDVESDSTINADGQVNTAAELKNADAKEKRDPVGLGLGQSNTDADKQENALVAEKRISVIDISPIPKPQPKENKRKSRCKRSEILTSSPMKEVLKAKHDKQQKKTEKALKKLSYKNAVSPASQLEKSQKKPCTKKATCRKDKRPVRPTGKLPLPPRPKKRRSSAKVAKSSESEFYCLICSEPYTDPPVETWIQCDRCAGWCHEDCTGGCTSRGYICDFCQ